MWSSLSVFTGKNNRLHQHRVTKKTIILVIMVGMKKSIRKVEIGNSTFMPFLNVPEHTRMNAIRSLYTSSDITVERVRHIQTINTTNLCLGSRFACSLKTNPENSSLSGEITLVKASALSEAAAAPLWVSALRPLKGDCSAIDRKSSKV